MEAYSDTERRDIRKWFDSLEHAVGDETVLPASIDEAALKTLLHDLYDINNRSLVDVLETKFERLGYSVAAWWQTVEKWYKIPVSG